MVSRRCCALQLTHCTATDTCSLNGNLATVTDRRSQVTTNTYDALNRKTKTTFQDGTSTNYTYDAGNRITQVQDKDARKVRENGEDGGRIEPCIA